MFVKNSCSVVNRFRGIDAVISTQNYVNSRGSFFEVSKFVQRGYRQCIIIQSGRADWGWKCVANHLPKFNGIRNVSGIYRREDRKSMGNFIPSISDSGKIDVGEHFHS